MDAIWLSSFAPNLDVSPFFCELNYFFSFFAYTKRQNGSYAIENPIKKGLLRMPGADKVKDILANHQDVVEVAVEYKNGDKEDFALDGEEAAAASRAEAVEQLLGRINWSEVKEVELEFANGDKQEVDMDDDEEEDAGAGSAEAEDAEAEEADAEDAEEDDDDEDEDDDDEDEDDGEADASASSDDDNDEDEEDQDD